MSIPKISGPRSMNSVMSRDITLASHSKTRQTISHSATPMEPASSFRTVCGHLQAAGLHGRRSVKKKFIPAKNGKARLTCAGGNIIVEKLLSGSLWSDANKFLFVAIVRMNFVDSK